jgi:hypothetical protein
VARRLKWFALSVVAATLFASQLPSASAASAPPYSVTAKLGGKEVKVVVGSVISKGQPQGDSCLLTQPSELSVTFPDSGGAFALEIQSGVNDNCDLVIESIKPFKDPPTAPPPSEGSVSEEPTTALSPQVVEQDVTALAGVRHFGWAKHRVEEYIAIPVTRTYVEMKYTRDGTHVWAGTVGKCSWWNDGLGWEVTSKGCTWNPSGPTSVWIRGGYFFSSWIPPQPSYTLWARFIADPGPRHTCSLTDGVVPAAWRAYCTGGIYW